MAKDYTVKGVPAKWISAHRENRYRVMPPSTNITNGVNAGGFLKLKLGSAFPYAVNVGDRIFISVGTPYSGYNIVREVIDSVNIILETPFNGSLGGSIPVYLIRLPKVSMYKGYKSGEVVLPWADGDLDLYNIQPYELVANFLPESGIDGVIDFDICGYAKTAIEAPYKAAYNVDEDNFVYVTSHLVPIAFYVPKYYNKISIIINDTFLIGEHYAANAAIETSDLNRNFVNTGRQMQPLKQPVRLFDEFSIGDYIEGDLLFAYIKNQ